MRLDTDEIAAATGGQRLGAVVGIDGASIDSRSDVGGRLFVPIVAERDGHVFIDAALDAGATAYLTARADTTGRPAVQVDDTLRALGDLGRLARTRLADRVVGVTGSVGKTSTKDLLAAVLTTTYRTCANEASFNNEMGVPLTLLSAAEDTEAVVTEMGARGIGHIAMLCALARPTVGVVTAIAGAHLEMFGSVAEVAVAKGELVEALPASGTAVLNADFDLVAGLATRTEASVLRYGIDRADVDVHAEGLALGDDLRPRFTLRSPWGSAPVHLSAHGAHQASNALGAAAAGLAVGVELEAVVDALGRAALSPMRMDVRRRADGLVVIDDTYNANPTSMAAALRALAAVDAKRRIAVLGEMAELGATSADEHRAIADLAGSLGIAVIAVGTTQYGPGTHVVGGTGEVVILLGGAGVGLGDGDAVLVKGSRVAGLESVARRLA
jgi:UDP-N-acetylmuramoyl-tripeptide--D-alanyl-D-alanine ligase